MIRFAQIQRHDLDEVGEFLHSNLNRRNSPAAWQASVTRGWSVEQPDYGVQMRDDRRLVGVFLATYSDLWIDGKLEKFCNPHSWCVLPSHRTSGISLVLRLVRIPGYHFTMFTPNAKVAEIFRGLKFKDLDDRLFHFPNLPSPAFWRPRIFTSKPEEIRRHLAGQTLKVFQDHGDIPWLRFVAFGEPGDINLAIFKPIVVKRLPTAWLLYVSDDRALLRHGAVFRHGMLWEHGMALSQIEARFVAGAPAFSVLSTRSQPKLFLSRSLTDRQIPDVYSELASLDV